MTNLLVTSACMISKSIMLNQCVPCDTFLVLFSEDKIQFLIVISRVISVSVSVISLGLWLGRLICYSTYRKIPKISPGAYIFHKAFLRGLFLEGLTFGGAYVRREICISKSIGLACSGEDIYHFCSVFLCILRQIPSTSPPGGLY